MDPKTLFDQKLPQAISQSPEKVKPLNAVFQFNLSGDEGGTWTLDAKSDPPTVAAGTTDSADCTIDMAAEDFKSMMQNPQMGMQLFFQGKLKIKGDPMLATKLQNILSLV